MAHFVLNGRKLADGETISSPLNQMVIVGLWGPMNTFVDPAVELKVEPLSTDRAKVKKSILPIAGNIRKWEITGIKTGPVKIEAKAGSDSWYSLVLDVKPSQWKFLVPEKQKFIEDLAREGRSKAKEFGYPLSAMLACGCSESGFGTSDIYKRTKNPFNLQKPEDWEYPKCETEKAPTVNKQGEQAKPATFCLAKNLGDAARQWCEWIKYYPNEAGRSQLMTFVTNPKVFAEKLSLVGFADNKEAATKEFGKVWQDFELGLFD